MIDLAQLLALADRVEAATGADREIVNPVHEALGKCAHRETEHYYIEDGNDYDSGSTCLACRVDMYGQRLPNYVGDVTAALTFYPTPPEMIPADPRKALAAALRARAEMQP